MPINPRIKFINDENKHQYSSQILRGLEEDFNSQGQPAQHFWYNRLRIAAAFERTQAVVALNADNGAIAYATWSTRGITATIDILEVKAEYRKQGLAKDMLAAFPEQFPAISVLTAHVLPSAEGFFKRLGWCKVEGTRTRFNILHPGVAPMGGLPDGCVIAVCREDYYKVKGFPREYRKQYFPVTVGEDGRLSAPVVAPFHPDAYMGIYYNQKLLVEGKVRNLFSNFMDMCDPESHVLAIDRIVPCQPSLLQAMSQPSPIAAVDRKRAAEEPLSGAVSKKRVEGGVEGRQTQYGALFQASKVTAPDRQVTETAEVSAQAACRR